MTIGSRWSPLPALPSLWGRDDRMAQFHVYVKEEKATWPGWVSFALDSSVLQSQSIQNSLAVKTSQHTFILSFFPFFSFSVLNFSTF